MPPNRKISFSAEGDTAVSLQLAVPPIKRVDTFLVAQYQPFQEKEDHTTTTTASVDYWDWAAFENKNDRKDDLQGEKESSSVFECIFSIHYIEAKLIQEAAERLLQQGANKADERVAVTVDVDDDSLDSSSYWDMPTDEQALVASWVIENNQPQKKHHLSGLHNRPQHHAAPTGMDVKAYWNDSENNQEDTDDYWNDPSHFHYKYRVVKGASARTPPHHGTPAVDLDMMISYWDEAGPANATIMMTTTDAYWTDPAASHDKLGYWDWPIVSFADHYYFDNDDDEEEPMHQPGCSVTQNDSYWLF